jgi:DNA-binding PadR family transcriptional regulator
MQRDGLVIGRKIAQQSRPAKTVYAITSKGQRTLVEWLRQKPPLPPVKDVMLLKTFAFNLLSAEEAGAQLRHHEKLRRQRLELYLDIKRQLTRRHGDLLATDDPILFWNGLCLQHEIAYERMYVAWCKWALARCRDFHRRRGNEDVRRELAQ